MMSGADATLAYLSPEVRAAGGENRFGVSDEALGWRRYNLGLAVDPPGTVRR